MLAVTVNLHRVPKEQFDKGLHCLPSIFFNVHHSLILVSEPFFSVGIFILLSRCPWQEKNACLKNFVPVDSEYPDPHTSAEHIHGRSTGHHASVHDACKVTAFLNTSDQWSTSFLLCQLYSEIF